MKHFFAFCRRNRLFAALLAAELAVVYALAAGLFGTPYKLALTPGDFTNTLPDIAAADDDGLKIWNQIGYHSDDPMTFSADNIALPSGAYEVTVRYFSCQTPDAPTFNMLNAAGSLTFASERNPAAVTFDALRLDDCHRSLTTRLWVGFGARMQDLTATVTYDQGQLYIYSITLTEQPIYRAARLLCFLVLFAAADAALTMREPLDVVNVSLIPALDAVGDGFEKGTVFLPQLLQAATAAQAAFEAIKAKIAASGQAQGSKGKIVIATVKGDVHDIGKNIVRVILENYGYDVLDLGRDVDPERVVEAVRQTGAKLVGLSALMTTTVPNMQATIEALHAAHLDCKVMVGGAVLTPDYARDIGADYYCKDAKASADLAKQLLG